MLPKAIVVTRMPHHSKTISTKAPPGERNRKNRADHATLSNNCTRKSCIGTAVKLLCRQTSQAANAIARNRIVHAGPNNQFGGVHRGLFKEAYHGRSAGWVSADPSPAATRQTAMQTMSRINEFVRLQAPECLSLLAIRSCTNRENLSQKRAA